LWRTPFLLLACLAPVLAAPAPTLSPPQALQLAYRDVVTLGPPLRPYALYVWIGPHVPDEGLDLVTRVLSGMVNGMSQEADLVPLRVVPGSGGRLLSLSLLDYRWSPRTVDQFARTDPYFYEIVTEHWPGGGGWARGDYRVPALAAYAAEGPAREPARDLLAQVQGKGRRQVPIVSLTSFVFQTFVSTNGPPTYNDFLGVKTENDFFRVTGVRADEDERFEQNLLAIIAESGIAYEPRAVEKREKIGGALWRTHDFAKAIAGQNPFQNLGRDGKTLRAKADAHEDYAHLPNNLWAMGLFNGAGAAQNNAPDTITTGDGTTTDTRDHRVHLPLGCIRCHTRGGMQDLDDWVRNLQQPPPLPPLALQVGNKANPKDLESALQEALRLRRQYGPSLLPALEQGRARYAAALLEVTGMQPHEYAAAVGKVWRLIAEPHIDSAWAARDLGVSEESLVACLEREITVQGGTDVFLSQFRKPRDQQKGYQLRQWLEAYPRAQRLLRGIADADVKGAR
jgi:hypothetical protein